MSVKRLDRYAVLSFDFVISDIVVILLLYKRHIVLLYHYKQDLVEYGYVHLKSTNQE